MLFNLVDHSKFFISEANALKTWIPDQKRRE